MLRFVMLAWSILMLGLAAPADAALLQFTISGTDALSAGTPAPTIFASFQLDSTPTISPVNVAAGVAFGIADVAGTFQYGQTVRTTPQPITFYHMNQSGGLAVGLDLFLVFDGPQLYTGAEATPTFKTGNFTLTNFSTRSQIGLTITQIPAAVPEPASWAMMLTGFGLVGGMMRHRRRTTTVSRA